MVAVLVQVGMEIVVDGVSCAYEMHLGIPLEEVCWDGNGQVTHE